MAASNTIAIHPVAENLRNLKACIEICHPETTVHAFRDPLLAMQFAVNNPVESVYTVVSMNRMNGFDVARFMRRIKQKAPINFIDQGEAYRKDAERLPVRTYLLEPVTAEKLLQAEAEAAALEKELEDLFDSGGGAAPEGA